VLLPVSLVPSMIGMSGSLYFFSALILSLGLAACGLSVVLTGTVRAARRLLLASVVYLPVLLLAMALDRLPPPLR
jgi:protoheme IX farnesyltransferase